MSDNKTVSVVIYGQEYTLSGDMERDKIMKCADHVDAKMKELGAGTAQPMSSVAVLAAMLIADEYYRRDEDVDDLLAQVEKLSEDSKNYEHLWEEVKQNFADYKNEMATLNTLKDNLQRYASEKEQQVASLSDELNKEKNFNIELRNRIDELTLQAQSAANAPLEAQKHIEEVENRCRDIESSFFDIQMENIQLKNEIESLRSHRI